MIDALKGIRRFSPRFGMYSYGGMKQMVDGDYVSARRAAQVIKAERATIARLTTELEVALKEQDRLAKAWEAKHAYQVKQSKGHDEYFDKSQRRMHELVAERDQARAEAAAAYEKIARAAEERAWSVGLAGHEIRALATEAETAALAEIVKQAVDAETRACAQICDRNDQVGGWVSRDAILARIDQRKEAGA